MTRVIRIEALDPAAFAAFGDVIAASGEPDRIINQERCGRWHDLARLRAADGRLGLSLFRSVARKLPFELTFVERHRLGSQAFMPLAADPYLAIVCPDEEGRPGQPRAFLASGGEGVNYLPGTWHAVLTPLAEATLFAVIDRIADDSSDDDTEVHEFETPYRIER
ncbi:MAG: ureidoglycolate lyase [Gammaproteobacteria bacterium]|nr:ureidoglycolate lyase [Gammaproteobacteria bacterium]